MENKLPQAIKNAIGAFRDTLSSKSEDTDNQSPENLPTENSDPVDSVEDVAVVPQPAVTEDEPTADDEPAVVDEPVAESENDVKADEPAVEDEPAKPDEPADKPDADFVSDLDKPETRLKTVKSLPSGGYVLGFSIQGRSHIAMQVPCQDYHAFEDLGDGWLLAITSDGAGSARESARGSKANCELALRLTKQLLTEKGWKKNNYLPTDKEWYAEIRNLFEVIQAIVCRSAASQVDSYREEQEKALSALEAEYEKATEEKKREIQQAIDRQKENLKTPLEPRDFNATLILLLISPKGMMAAHIGDGRMGYQSEDGVWKALMTPHKGDEASSTVFIPSNWNRQLNVPAFTMSDVYLPDTCVVNERPKAFILMSDGCESFSWTCKVYDKERNFYYDKNEPYEKFLTPLVNYLDGIKDPDERVDKMIDTINVGTIGGKKEQDDRTMLLGVL